jgi:DNA-binding NtrC family response regulator
MSRVTLLGLPDDLASQLSQVLRDEAHKVIRKLHLQDLRHGPKSGAVFISGDAPDFRDTIAQLRESDPVLPVIVVTRTPGTTRWLDALDAGATDYCGAPFERVQLRWILDSAIRAEACAACA